MKVVPSVPSANKYLLILNKNRQYLCGHHQNGDYNFQFADALGVGNPY